VISSLHVFAFTAAVVVNITGEYVAYFRGRGLDAKRGLDSLNSKGTAATAPRAAHGRQAALGRVEVFEACESQAQFSLVLGQSLLYLTGPSLPDSVGIHCIAAENESVFE
jgi:hypothetical protein